MNTNRLKPPKTSVLRARVTERLKEDVARVCVIQQLDEADVVRIGVNNYIQTILSNGLVPNNGTFR